MASIEVISGLDEDDPSFDLSGDRDVAALLDAEQRHFWHRTRNRIVVDRLARLGVGRGARLLELGCGGGCVSAALRRAGLHVTGVDGHRRLLEVAARRDPALRLWQHDLRRGVAELPEHDFDAAGLFDVLEHLDDPLAALEGTVACVKPGGLVAGTVPALMLLWSSIDRHSGHKLRYSRRTLGDLLGRVRGARVLTVAPFNRVLVAPMLAQRRRVGRGRGVDDAVENLAVPPRAVNGLLGAAVLAEHCLARWLDRTPIEGASLWFALRRA
jgi:SAM-dependent methyltransferase